MATNKKPRKAYRPKDIARPLTPDQRRNLELSARVHANALWLGHLTDEGWNTLVALFNVVYVAAEEKSPSILEQASNALRQLVAIKTRYDKTGKFGATGDERKSIMDAFNATSEFLMTRTDAQLARSIKTVYRALGVAA